MALVAYSDSEGSDSEPSPTLPKKSTPATRPAQSTAAAAFAIDKSNPRKLRVTLEAASEPQSHNEKDEHAAKRPRIGGGGGFSGFNSMLPAPKRETMPVVTSSGWDGKPARKIFSLKTGAEPGFSRESDAELRQIFSESEVTPMARHSKKTISTTPASSDAPKMGNPMMFKPLSVARNPNKKKPIIPREAIRKAEQFTPSSEQKNALISSATPKTPKISLFSTGLETGDVPVGQNYEEEGEEPDLGITEPYENAQDTFRDPSSTIPVAPNSQSLDAIASDLNLSAADRRQLFGRDGKGSGSAINVVNFNTDQEYAANEVLRNNGEQVQHNPVRGIAPGKHSLKQLMNAASTQKEALEESFATGRRNKREAGNKYGW